MRPITSRIGKRALDLSVVLLALPVALPIMVAVSIWVRSDSPGPALFRQERVGLNGRRFRIHKFRTMHVQAAGAGLQLTAEGDARITRAGRWLRRTKLDELPQLMDVLLGDMSLVGPRPEVPHYMDLYPEGVRQKILSVKPGITDRAAIEFIEEERLLAASDDPETTYVQEVMPLKQTYYLEYVDHHSVMGDIRILLDTLRALVR